MAQPVMARISCSHCNAWYNSERELREHKMAAHREGASGQENPAGGNMATIQEKTARLASAQQKVDAFIAAGGDLKSPAAAPIGLEFVNAFAVLAKEFGYDVLKPIKKDSAK